MSNDRGGNPGVILPFGISKPQKASSKQEKAKIQAIQTTVLKSAFQIRQEEAEKKQKVHIHIKKPPPSQFSHCVEQSIERQPNPWALLPPL